MFVSRLSTKRDLRFGGSRHASAYPQERPATPPHDPGSALSATSARWSRLFAWRDRQTEVLDVGERAAHGEGIAVVTAVEATFFMRTVEFRWRLARGKRNSSDGVTHLRRHVLAVLVFGGGRHYEEGGGCR
jgi:hypothetical protein